MRRTDLTGHRFGRLEVLEMVYAGKNPKVRCRCNCGGEVTALAYNVRNGNTASCGCLSRESRKVMAEKYGMTVSTVEAIVSRRTWADVE